MKKIAIFIFLSFGCLQLSMAVVPPEAGDTLCKFNKTENPFFQFLGTYTVVSHTHTCTQGSCDPIRPAQEITLSKDSDSEVRFVFTYGQGSPLHVVLPNDFYDDVDYRVESCGNSEMARFFLDNKDSVLQTRIIFLRLFAGFSVIIDDGIYSDVIVLQLK